MSEFTWTENTVCLATIFPSPRTLSVAEFQYGMVQLWNAKEQFPLWQDAAKVCSVLGGVIRETLDFNVLDGYAADEGELWMLNAQLVYILSEGTCVAEPNSDALPVDNLTSLADMHKPTA